MTMIADTENEILENEILKDGRYADPLLGVVPENPVVAIAMERLDGLDAEEVANLLRATGNTGSRRHANKCPIASYLRSETGSTDVGAGTTLGHVVLGGEWHCVQFPAGVSRFISRFDHGDFRDLVDNA